MKSALIVLLTATIMSSVHAQTTFGPSTDYPFGGGFEECRDDAPYMRFDPKPQSFSVHATKTVLTTGGDAGKIEYDITSVTLSRCPSQLSSDTDPEITQVSPVLIHNNIFYKLSAITGGTEECNLSIVGKYQLETPSCTQFCTLSELQSTTTTEFVASVGDTQSFLLGSMYYDERELLFGGTSNNQYQNTVFARLACNFNQQILASECGTDYYANAGTTNLCSQCSTVSCDPFKTAECTSTTDASCCPDGEFAVNGICTDNHCNNVNPPSPI